MSKAAYNKSLLPRNFPHPFVGRYNKHNASDGYLDGGGSSGSHPFGKNTSGVFGAKNGTTSPYIQLLACKKL